MAKFLLLLAGLYLVLATTAYLLADRMIFLPPPSSYTRADLPVVFVPVPGTEAVVAAIHLPNPRATHTILFSHGNAEDLGHLAGFLERLRAAGFSVLAYDYRGYGLSGKGAAGSRAAEADIRAVYAYAREELGIDPSRLIVHGRSLGSGPATALAATEPVAGLILESAFTSAFRVVLPFPLLPFDRFRNRARLLEVSCPVLVIHGTEDEVIAADHARGLYAAAREPRELVWIQGAGHNDLVAAAGDRYWKVLRSFSDRIRESVSL